MAGIDNLDGLAVSALEKDVYGRSVRKYIKNLENNTVGSETFGYLSVREDNGTRLTSIVDSITQNYGGEEETLRYVYDDNGNITFVFKDDDLIARDESDGMNQLIKEANFELGLRMLMSMTMPEIFLQSMNTVICTMSRNRILEQSLILMRQAVGRIS